jgi:hypothetical protein
MGKAKRNEKLYERMRVSGVRKRVARELAQLPRMGSDGKRVPKGVRQTFERLQAVVSELEGHAGRSDRKASARKAARTRRSNAKRRSSSARKGSRTRART